MLFNKNETHKKFLASTSRKRPTCFSRRKRVELLHGGHSTDAHSRAATLLYGVALLMP